MKQKLLLLLLLGLAGRLPVALGQVTAASGITSTYTSAVAGVLGKTIWDMYALNKSDLFSFDATKRTGGIIGTAFGANASVTVAMYRFDPSASATNYKGATLYTCTSTITTADYGGTSLPLTPSGYSFGSVSGAAAATLALHDFAHATGTRPFFLLSAPVPVIIEVTISGATFTRAKIPGIGVYTLTAAGVSAVQAARVTTTATASTPASAALPLALELFPNPAQGRTTLHLTVPAATAATAELLDLQGRRVLRQSLELQAGENYHEMPLGNVAAGLYLLEVRLAGSAGKAGRLVQRLQVE